MAKCSICRIEGHNKKTCPSKPKAETPAPAPAPAPAPLSSPPEPEVACSVCNDIKEIYKKGRCLECHRARKAAKKAAKEEIIEDSASTNHSVSSGSGPWQTVKSARKPLSTVQTGGSDLCFIFKYLRTGFNSATYFMLRDMFHLYPERFTIIGLEHFSRGEEEPHIVVEIATPYRRWDIAGAPVIMTPKNAFHVYYTPIEGSMKKLWKSISTVMYSPEVKRMVSVQVATLLDLGSQGVAAEL